MRTYVWGVGVAVCLLATAGFLSADDKDDAVKKEMQKFEGTWEIVSIEKDGNKQPLPEGQKAVTVFKGGQVRPEDRRSGHRGGHRHH